MPRGEEGVGETFYGDFKEIKEVMLPKRILAYYAGKKFMELTVTEIKFLKKLDPRSSLSHNPEWRRPTVRVSESTGQWPVTP
jgi:hypothetical protein